MFKNPIKYLLSVGSAFGIGLLVGTLLMACATVYIMPKFQDRIYRPCDKKEIADNVGKLCFKRCANYGMFSKKCKEWEYDIKNFCEQEDFTRFETAGYKCMVAP